MNTDDSLIHDLTNAVAVFVRLISGDSEASTRTVPVGNELMLIVSAPNQTGRLLGRDGETLKALKKIVSAASWRVGRTFRIVLNDSRISGDSESDGTYSERTQRDISTISR